MYKHPLKVLFKSKYNLLLSLAVLFISIKGFGADSTHVIIKKNVLSVTFGGKENLGSVNYEHIFSTGKKLYWSYSVGVQPFAVSNKFSVPISMNTFTKGSLHHLEFDLTATFFMDKFHPYD